MSQPPLLPHLRRLTHVFQPEHQIISEGFERPEGPNFGRNGEHLTIMFLSMNRSGLSEKLCRSIVEHIPNFRGEILAVDNASTDEEFEAVSRMLADLPLRTRIVRLERNHGVAGGRNRGMAHVRTDWVMSIDNDIYFVANPLMQWQREIASMGCRFFSLALYDPGMSTVFLRGGHLYVSSTDQDIYLGGGSCCPADDARDIIGEPFFGSCMMGGASIYHAESFRRMGMYDDAMFIGFEDYEFSLRLFREGYKVGCSAVAALVHDHPKPETAVDTDYEKVRFQRNHLAESAIHFERKHGIKVWHKGVEAWLTERQRELGIVEETDAPVTAEQPKASAGVAVTEKPRILLVIDQTGWAFSNIADQIVRGLSHKYDVDVTATHELDNFGQLMLLGKQADLIHFFWRPQLMSIFDPGLSAYATAVGVANDHDLRWAVLQKKLTTAIYDHLFLDPESVAKYRTVLGKLVDGYYTSSAKLDQTYRKVYPEAVPLGLIPDGVDLTRFRPLPYRPRAEGEPLRVGWVGNSKWAADLEDFKGLHSIIRPALSELDAEGLSLTEVFADRHVEMIPHALMSDYYGKIDLLLCASKIEGTPNPVLEAMACGVPIITTDVGIVPEAFGPKQKQLILPSRDKESLKTAIREVYFNRELLYELREENLISIIPWDWSRRVTAFEMFFDSVLSKPGRTRSGHGSDWRFG